MIPVSLIIPVYNAEKWLTRCLDSVVSQRWSDMEIILVDDGSTDTSHSICDHYAQKETRIKLIRQKNQGVATSRQNAIDHAQGEYVAFVDADDWVENDYLEKLVSTASDENADMVICDYYDERPGETRHVKQQPVSLDHHAIQVQLNGNLMGVLWNKLIRRSVFSDFSITFPGDLRYGEDKYVLMKILNHPIKVAYTPYALYHFDQKSNMGSLTRAHSATVFKNMIQFYQRMLDEFNGDVKDGISYIMVFYSYKVLNSGYLSQSDYSSAFQGKRQTILKAKGRLYKRITVFLATFKTGWPISKCLHRVKDKLSTLLS